MEMELLPVEGSVGAENVPGDLRREGVSGSSISDELQGSLIGVTIPSGVGIELVCVVLCECIFISLIDLVVKVRGVK